MEYSSSDKLDIEYSRKIVDIRNVLLRRIFLVTFSALFLSGVGLAFKIYRDMGGFKTIQTKQLEDCRPVLGVLSSEDITIDPETGFAFLSGDDRRGRRGERFPGAISRAYRDGLCP